MSWRDAYEEQVVLYRFWHTATAAAYARGFAMDALNKGRQHEANFLSGMDIIEKNKLEHAEPIWVDADMVDLVDTASKQFEPEPLEPEDLLVPFGFALLEKPLVNKDVWGKTMSFRAISWGMSTELPMGANTKDYSPEDLAERSGVTVCFYAHIDDPDDYNTAIEAIRESDLARYKLSINHMANWRFGQGFDAMGIGKWGEEGDDSTTVYMSDKPKAPRGHWSRAEWERDKDAMSEWEKDADGPGEYKNAPDGEIVRAYGELWSQMQVLLRMMNQKISTVSREKVDRKAVRRAKREGIDPGGDYVTVITLRRLREAGEQEGAEVEWGHRWIVRGHWRNQWYATLNRHRRIWISPFIKGPEDKELRISTKRAFELVR